MLEKNHNKEKQIATFTGGQKCTFHDFSSVSDFLYKIGSMHDSLALPTAVKNISGFCCYSQQKKVNAKKFLS